MKKLFKSVKRKKGTLYSMITGNYIMFAVIVVITALLIFGFFNLYMGKIESNYEISRIIEQESYLKSGNYEKLQVERYLGKGSYIEVLDRIGKVLYCSDKAVNNSYTDEIIEYIPAVDGTTFYSLEKIYDNGAASGYLMLRYSYDDEQYTLNSVAVLDASRKIVFSDDRTEGKTMSEKEIDFLNGGFEESTFVQKYEYTDNRGDERVLLIHDTYENANETGAYRKGIFSVLLLFIITMGIILIVFVLRVSFVVKKPLDMLENAMAEFSVGSEGSGLSYSGPREFVEIIDTFNNMSIRLKESEKLRIKSENEKQKMLADISHDLKTPITVIQGYSKAIADGVVPREDEKKYLETIRAKSENLSELINIFYEYSKLDHPEFSLSKENGDICEYFREYLALKYEELDLAGFLMEIDIPDESLDYCFDRIQLKRVFENIISNSVKSNRKGTTIFASLSITDSAIIIRLGDDGIGIPDSLRSNIFEPFVVGNESRTSGQGTGLGLSIAKLIVEAHGGKICLLDSDKTCRRTMFEISLFFRG